MSAGSNYGSLLPGDLFLIYSLSSYMYMYLLSLLLICVAPASNHINCNRGLPGSPLFEMAERAVSDPAAQILIEGRRRGGASGNEKDDEDSSSTVPLRSGGEQLPDDVRDYVYIDDAVDAIMTAMQYRPASKSTGDGIGAAPNLMINVGSGRGSTLRDVASIMEEHFARSPKGARSATKSEEHANAKAEIDPSVSIASTDRAELLLGFNARVSLEEGIANLLAWHFDRAFPYGGKPPPPPGSSKADGVTEVPGNEKVETGDDAKTNKILTGGHTIADHGIEACSPFDRECLHGAPVFPCASECSHESHCIKSYFDDATHISRSITAGCDAVLYTVHLGDDIENIPSAHTAISTDSVSYFDDKGKRCNVAFVSEGSKLVRRLKKEKGLAQFVSVSEEFLRRINEGGRGAADVLITHGCWTLIPVATPPRPSSQEAPRESSESYDDWNLLRMVPKISPGLFFSGQTKHAIYAHPNITFANIHNLLREAKMQPYKEGMRGATAAVVGDGHAEAERRRARGDKAKFGNEGAPNTGSSWARSGALQLRAYNMIRVGLQGEMLGGGDIPIADSSWIVHTLGVEDARLFRCDVLGEIIQWDVGSDERSLEFVMGLHDLWSRVIVSWGGVDPWWKKGSEEVSVVPMTAPTVATPAAPETPIEKARANRRRLTELSNLPADVGGHANGSHTSRRLDERPGDSDVSASADGLWMGVLSSTEIHYFVRILPTSTVGAVHVDEYSS